MCVAPTCARVRVVYPFLTLDLLGLTCGSGGESFVSAAAFLSFVNKSPSPFHAVHETIQTLSAAGFKPLREEESWKDAIHPGGKYYVTRNQSAIVRFPHLLRFCMP